MAASIGILDMSGFENFPSNSFEQLNINVANEQLQYYFNDYIFSQEEKEYESEGVGKTGIVFKNNEELLELFFEVRKLLFLP